LCYSGHGWLDETSGCYYLVPHDVEPFDLPGSALPAEQFTKALRQVPARRLLVILDCCHAAGMATAKGAPAFKLPPNFLQTEPPKGVLDASKVRGVWCSCHRAVRKSPGSVRITS
jgi:hypothetical protein